METQKPDDEPDASPGNDVASNKGEAGHSSGEMAEKKSDQIKDLAQDIKSQPPTAGSKAK